MHSFGQLDPQALIKNIVLSSGSMDDKLQQNRRLQVLNKVRTKARLRRRKVQQAVKRRKVANILPRTSQEPQLSHIKVVPIAFLI